MRDVDTVRVRELLGHLADARRRLGEAAALSEAEFLADARNPASAKYLLIVAAEAAIDVCNHIVARRGGRAHLRTTPIASWCSPSWVFWEASSRSA